MVKNWKCEKCKKPIDFPGYCSDACRKKLRANQQSWKKQGLCVFCGESKNLKPIGDALICPKCRADNSDIEYNVGKMFNEITGEPEL